MLRFGLFYKSNKLLRQSYFDQPKSEIEHPKFEIKNPC